MREAVEQLLAQLWIILHHRYIVMVVAIVVSCCGWFAIEFIPDKYKADTKVFLDTQSVLKNLLQGLAIDSDTREQSALVMQRTLVTRPNMQKVILETDLNLTVNGPRETEDLINTLMDSISINSVDLVKKSKDNSNLYNISFTHEDPRLAKDVIVVLLNIFVESILGESRKDTHNAEEFLDEQIKQYEQRQFEAEERLKLFKQKNLGFMPEEGQSIYTSINNLELNIEATKLSLVETENRIIELKRQIKSLVTSASSLNGDSSSAVPNPLDVRIDEMEKKLDDLLLHYTENHPDVINTRLVIEQLKEKKSSQRVETPGESNTVDSSVLTLPLYQELNVMLGQAQSEAVALRTRFEEYKRQKEEKKELLNTLSEVEAELANLNRDYAINKQMYEDLVVRRESSNLSSKADQTGDKLQFKIIEPPRVPLVPDSPNRLMLTTAVLFAALAAGAGIALLLEQLRPTFYTRHQLMDSTDIPVIGVVSMFWTKEEKRKRQLGLVLLGVVALVLLGVYAGVLVHNGLSIEKIQRMI